MLMSEASGARRSPCRLPLRAPGTSAHAELDPDRVVIQRGHCAVCVEDALVFRVAQQKEKPPGECSGRRGQYGQHDLRPRSAVDSLEHALPRVQRITLAGTVHNPWAEDAEAFSRAVTHFLTAPATAWSADQGLAARDLSTALRRRVVADRRLPKLSVTFVGYWKQGCSTVD